MLLLLDGNAKAHECAQRLERFTIESLGEGIGHVEVGGDVMDSKMTVGNEFAEIVPLNVEMLDARVEHSVGG